MFVVYHGEQIDIQFLQKGFYDKRLIVEIPYLMIAMVRNFVGIAQAVFGSIPVRCSAVPPP